MGMCEQGIIAVICRECGKSYNFAKINVCPFCLTEANIRLAD